MKTKKKFKLKTKLAKRFFWYLSLMTPTYFRKKMIRSRFEVDYNLDPNIQYKLATTKDELRQALNLVYNAYVDLNYIDQNKDKIHLTKYLTLPTTTILIIKHKEKVVGTMSIVLDSALGLPVETTWSIDEYKKNGKSLAEISALTISREMKSKKGHVLFPLCKFMYLMCREYLHLDGIVIATTHEVEPFYTDLLLFKKISANAGGKTHNLVKGNKSSCCILPLDYSFNENYHREYAHKRKEENFYHFFVNSVTPNIIFPKKMISVQAMLKEKNESLVELLREEPHLLSRFTEKEQLIIKNLEPENRIKIENTGTISDRKHPRLAVILTGIIKSTVDLNTPIPVKITDISTHGFKIKTLDDGKTLQINEHLFIEIDNYSNGNSFSASVMWAEKNKFFGCLIDEFSEKKWKDFYNHAWNEYSNANANSEDQEQSTKKTA